MIIELKPHKTLERIEQEYNLKFSNKELEELAYATEETFRTLSINPIYEKAEEIGKKHGLDGKDLENFVADVVLTCTYYYINLHVVLNVFKIGG